MTLPLDSVRFIEVNGNNTIEVSSRGVAHEFECQRLTARCIAIERQAEAQQPIEQAFFRLLQVTPCEQVGRFSQVWDGSIELASAAQPARIRQPIADAVHVVGAVVQDGPSPPGSIAISGPVRSKALERHDGHGIGVEAQGIAAREAQNVLEEDFALEAVAPADDDVNSLYQYLIGGGGGTV